MIWFQSDVYCWLDKDLNEDIYTRKYINSGKHYSTKLKQEIYSETDMVTKKWHYYFRISDNGIQEWRNVKKYMYYAKGWWNFVRIDRKWFVGINEVPGYLSSEVSLSMVSMVLIQSVTSSSYWPISWASRAAARCCLKSFRTMFSGCFSICHRLKVIQI